MEIQHSIRRSGVAILGIAAIAAGALGLTASPALAVPGDGGTGSITVHKLEQGSAPIGANDGSVLDTTGATPLVAGFTACVVDGVDLSVAADWERLKDMTLTLDASGDPVLQEGGAPRTLSACVEQTTAAATGATEFAGLNADRAYVVYESVPAVNAVTNAQPTLITVPYPGNGTGAAWNYNPHIYPKNVIAGSGATKQGEIIGDKVSFDVTLPINPLGATETYNEVRINDQLSNFLQYTGGAVKLLNSGGTEVALVANTDYTLSTPSGAGGDEVVLTMLAPGLVKVNANIGGSIVLTIDADAIGTGTTANEAQLTINGKTTDPGTGPEVIDPEEFFAGAHIHKDARNKGAASNVPLAGAGFDVYAVDAATTVCPATPAAGDDLVIDNDVSAASGDTPDHVLAAGKYCVYEVQVPQGYKGLNGGVLFDVTGADSEVTVVNTQIGSDAGDLPDLPITGAAASMLLLVAGGALLAVGIVFFVMRRRAQEEEPTAVS